MYCFVDRKKFEKGVVKFVSCGCLGDIVDFFPTGEFSYEKTDFDKVPTLSLARQFMRQKSIKPIWDKYKPISRGTNLSNYHRIMAFRLHLFYKP
jgi:hypothetical protein